MSSDLPDLDLSELSAAETERSLGHLAHVSFVRDQMTLMVLRPGESVQFISKAMLFRFVPTDAVAALLLELGWLDDEIVQFLATVEEG